MVIIQFRTMLIQGNCPAFLPAKDHLPETPIGVAVGKTLPVYTFKKFKTS